MKVWSEHPTLQKFFDSGPSECLKARLQSSNENNNHINGNAKPSIKVRHDSGASAPVPTTFPRSEINMPSINIAPVHGEDVISGSERSILEAPTIIVPKNIHTRRPPITTTSSDPESSNHLAPIVVPLQTSSAALERDPGRVHEPRPQRARTYQQPSQSTDRFRWVHIRMVYLEQ